MPENEMVSSGLGDTEPLELPGRKEENGLKNPPKLPLIPPDDPVPEPCKAQREGVANDILQRPLPELPMTRSRQSSTSSLRSNCPSLTPSLIQYVDSGEFDKEEVRLDIAHPVLIPSESMQALELGNGNDSKTSWNSVSDYGTSPDSTGASHSPERPSPEAYLPTTGSVLERHLTELESPIGQSSPSRSRHKIRALVPDNNQCGDEAKARVNPLELTEAEWLRHSPSPLRHAKRLWSPRPGKRASDSSSDGSIRREHVLFPTIVTESAPENTSGDKVVHANEIRDPPMGNWI